MVDGFGGATTTNTSSNQFSESDKAVGEQYPAVLIVDSTVEDSAILLDGLVPGTHVVRAEAGKLAEVAQELEALAPASAVHILTHGEPGAFTLGGERIDAASLENRTPIANALAHVAATASSIALWACNVGKTQIGVRFLDALSNLTGASVYASDQPVGASSGGGSWHIGIQSPFTMQAQTAYPHTLPASNENFDDKTLAGSTGTSFVVDDWTFTADTAVNFATADSGDVGFSFQLTTDGGAGDHAIFVNYNGGVIEDGFGFKTTDGTNFSLESFDLQNIVNGGSLTVTVTILSDAATVGSGTFDLTTTSTSNGITWTYGGLDPSVINNQGHYGSFSFSTAYQNVDEIRLVYSGGVNAGTFAIDNIVVGVAVLPNSAPDLGGTPADDTATEDVATAIDLSAYNVSDGDGDTITLTLAVDRGTIASTDGNGTTAGVTVATSGTTSMTLQGSELDLNNYLNDTTKITFTTDSNDTTSATLTVTPNDGTEDGTADTVAITITPVNDAPVLDNTQSPTLTAINEDAGDDDGSGADGDDDATNNANNTGTTVATMVVNSSITDADGSAVESIAVTVVDNTNGVWQYSTNGGTSWNNFSGVTGLSIDIETSARLLDSTSLVRFVPDADYNGSATITFRAWDESSGSVGGTANASTNGGSTAFSTASDTAAVTVNAVNDDPTISGLVTDVSVTEDTASNVDFSAVTFADVDSASMTVTLTASAGTFSTPADGAGVGGGVTETLVNSTTITLVGAPADINTYLDTASNIQYTGASNVSGNDVATITVTGNDGDGSGDVALGTVNVDIANVNDDPGATGVPTDVTVTEDTASNVNLSAITLSDVDSANVTLTLTASAGTFSTPADGAGVGGGVTETLVNATTITLAGAPADINTYLDTLSNIQYTGASNVNGNDAATITATVNDGDGSGDVALGTINLDITAVNDDPTISGLVTDVSVTEDTASNVDFSAVTFADVDSASMTVTLTASAGTFSTPADGAGVGGGVTETLVNSTTITLVGAPADINTYLDTASNIQYTGASNASGNDAATITVTGNDGDGSGDVALGTVNVDITAVNDAPVLNPAFTPTLTAIDEDAGDDDGSGADGDDDATANANNTGDTVASIVADGSITDVDGAAPESIAVTAVDNTNGSWQFSTDGGTNWTSINSGTTSDSNALLLDSTDMLRFVPGADYSGSSTITFRGWDQTSGVAGTFVDASTNGGTTAFSSSTDTASVTVNAVNDVPVFTGLDGTPSFTEGGSVVALDGDVTVSDAELDSLNGGNGDYSGATLTVVRNGGANTNDSLSVVSGGNLTVAGGPNGGGTITAGGNVIATIADAGDDDELTITFADNGTTPTTALVNEVMQAIRYSNSSNDPSASVQIDWSLSDGNSADAQGSGDNPGIATGSTTVSITSVNDAPTLSATGQNPTFTEGGASSDLFSGVTADTIEAGQTITSMTLTVTNVSDGADESLTFDGSTVQLTNGNVVNTATNGLTVSVSVVGTTATVSFTGATLTEAQLQTLVDGMAYANASDDPTTAGNRVVTITGITDSGGTANGGTDAATPNLTSTVGLTPVNDAPVISNLNGDSASEVVSGSGAQDVTDLNDVTVTNADSADYNGGSLLLTQGSGTANGSWGVDGTTVTSGGDATIAAGETISVGGTAIGTVHATNDGQGGSTLQIDFDTADSTSANIQTLIRALTYDGPSGIGARVFTLTLNDGDGTANGGDEDTAATFTLTVTPNPPVISNVDGDSFTFTEGDSATLLDVSSNATLTDADSANFDGGNITVGYQSGQQADDRIEIDTSGTVSLSAGMTAGSTVSVGGTAIGTIDVGATGGSSEDLTITFNSSATPARVQDLIQALQYNNASGDDPTDGDRVVRISVTDAGSNSATGTADVTVTVDAVNDEPTLTATGSDPTFTEDGSAADLFSGVTASTVESGQTVSSLTLTVTNVADTGSEILNIDGTAVTLDDAESGTTATNSLTYNVSVTAGTATVTLTGGTMSEAAVQTLVDGLSYENTSSMPSDTSNRVVTITSMVDSGGTANSGDDTAALALSSTVDVVAVNDAPVLDNTQSPVLTAIDEDAGDDDGSGADGDDDATNNANNTGNTVASIVVDNSITDSDGSPMEAIAVTAVDSDQGTWQFSINGGTSWTNINAGTTNDNNALLLRSTDMLRFIPNADATGTETVTFRAWDQSTGTAGTFADADPNGGTTAFSSATDTASITVNPVNDAPTVSLPANVTVTEETASNVDLSAANFGDIDSATITVTLSIDAGTFSAPADGAGVGGGVTETHVNATTITLAGAPDDIDTYLDTASNIQYTSVLDADTAGAATITVTANDGDGSGDVSLGTVSVDVTGVNDLPTSSGGSISTAEDNNKAFAESNFNFSDVDTADTLQSVRIDTLPSTGTLKLSGVDVTAGDVIAVADIGNLTYTPPSNQSGSTSFTYTVNDGTGFATSTATMNVSVSARNDAPNNISLSNSSVKETVPGAVIGTVSATDVDDDNSTLIYTVSDSRFIIDANNQLKLKAGQTLDFETESTVTVTLTATDDEGASDSDDFTITVIDVNEITGGNDPDTLDGGDDDDFVMALGGNDRVNTGNGRDTIDGGDGNDDINGGGDDDFLKGGTGNDTVDGGSGNDLVYAGLGDLGNDTVLGNSGFDSLGGGAGDDSINGGDNDDLLWGRFGSDTVDGGTGDDMLYNGEGNDTVIGGTGDDTLWAGNDDDLLSGGDGDDVFIFGANSGNDTITDFEVANDALDLQYSGAGFGALADVQAAASDVTQNGQDGLLIDLGNGQSVFLIGLDTGDLASMTITI